MADAQPNPRQTPDDQQETMNESREKPLTPMGQTDNADGDGPSTGQLDAASGADSPLGDGAS